MRVLTTAPDEVRELLAHWTEDSSLVVVALCAAWCHFGISLPQQSTVARLVDEMTNRTAGGSAAPDVVVNLPRTLRRRFA